MKRTPGRRTALCAGLACAAVCALGVLLAGELRVQHRLKRLRADPGLVENFVVKGKGSPERDALLRFVSTTRGREALLEGYLNNCHFVRVRIFLRMWRAADPPWISFWAREGKLFSRTPEGEDTYYLLEPEILEAFQNLLLEVGYDRQPIPGCPSLSFGIVTSEPGGRCLPRGCQTASLVEVVHAPPPGEGRHGPRDTR
jgi:hypothetical protein